MNAYATARRLIDAAHAADPVRADDGRPAELVYADRVEAWVLRLQPEASELLRLAARCQHLERWSVPRASFPLGRAGYLAWRARLYVTQADRARELLLQAGVPEAEAAEAREWVAKAQLRSNAGAQSLEDAAILVFLENESAAFVAKHAEYPREKFLDILRKSWRKLSARGQEAALSLPLDEPISGLVAEALQSVS